MSNKIKKIPKKWLFAGLAAAAALSAIALALSSSLAATPVDVKLSNPNPSFPTVEVGETVPHAMRGALSITPTGTIDAIENGPNTLPTASIGSAGAGKLSLASKYFTWEQDYQGVDPDQISGYYFGNGLSGYAPKGATTYQIPYHVYSTSGYTSSDNASSRAKISWSSASPLVNSVASDSTVNVLGNGIATLTGTFTDYWGTARTVAFALHIGDTSGRPDLEALQLAINDAETELATIGVYTSESLAALQTEVNSGKSVLNSTDPNQTSVDAATQDIRDAIAALVQDLPVAGEFKFVVDTSISPSNAVFGSTAKQVILQIGTNAGNNYQVDWGDGTVTTNTASHTYADAKEYTIKISGDLPGGIKFGNSSHGETRLKRVGAPLLPQTSPDLSYVFAGCSNLTSIPTGIFDLNPQVTNFTEAFRGCTKLTAIPAGLFDQNTATTTFQSTFQGCTALTTIPDGLFDQNPLVTTFQSTFQGCTTLTEVPTGLFDFAVAATTFQETFRGCTKLAVFPEGLFEYTTAVVNFDSTFRECKSMTMVPARFFAGASSLTIYDNTFRDSGIVSVPADLFAYSPGITSFKDTFSGCTLLTSVPPELFANNPLVTDFSGVFKNCTALTTVPAELFENNPLVTNFSSAFESSGIVVIPEGLFEYNTLVVDFGAVFANCPDLTTVPATVFSTNLEIVNLDYAFAHCPSITVLPPLWTITFPKLGAAKMLHCFEYDVNATNFGSVPWYWGGP